MNKIAYEMGFWAALRDQGIAGDAVKTARLGPIPYYAATIGGGGLFGAGLGAIVDKNSRGRGALIGGLAGAGLGGLGGLAGRAAFSREHQLEEALRTIGSNRRRIDAGWEEIEAVRELRKLRAALAPPTYKGPPNLRLVE